MLKSCIAILFLFFSFSTYASKSLPASISIAAPDISPLVYFNDNNEITGSLVEKLNAFSKRTGIQVSIEIMPWARALTQVKYGKHNALMPTLKSIERERFLIFPKQPLIKFHSSVLIQLKKQASEHDSITSLVEGKTLAKARFMLLGDEMDKLFANNKQRVIEVNSVEVAIKMLALGRVDFVATDKGIAQSVIKKLSLNETFTFISINQEASDSYLAFSQKFSDEYDIEALMNAINDNKTLGDKN